MNKQKRQEYYLERKLTKEMIDNSEEYLKNKSKKQYLKVKESRIRHKEIKATVRKILDECEKLYGIKLTKLSITTDGRGFYFDSDERCGLRHYSNLDDCLENVNHFIKHLKYVI